MPGKMTREELDRLLEAPEIGVLATVDADGRPEGSPIWFEHRGGKLYVHVDRRSKKARNIAVNPNVSVTVDTRVAPYRGAVLSGMARVAPYDEGVRRRTAIRYLGPEMGEGYLTMTEDGVAETVLLEIEVTGRFTWDYSKGL